MLVGHFGDVLPNQYLGLVLKKNKPNTTKAYCQHKNKVVYAKPDKKRKMLNRNKCTKTKPKLNS